MCVLHDDDASANLPVVCTLDTKRCAALRVLRFAGRYMCGFFLCYHHSAFSFFFFFSSRRRHTRFDCDWSSDVCSSDLVGSLEGLYRFTGEGQAVTPYAGGGFSLGGHDRCGADPDCPDVWLNVVVGVELHYRSTFNWLPEYHRLEGLRHNRLYARLTTRRGN